MSECLRCRVRDEGDREFFDWLCGHYRFDITRAKELAGDRPPVRLDRRLTREQLEGAQVDVGHLAHVDPAEPGVVGTVRVWSVPKPVLLDGHHRAARALADRVPFRARVLTEEETTACTTRQPRGKRQ
jgi:hypothetical protein